MATMNISLPDEMKAFVEERVQSGRYANASDYVRDLIRREQTEHDRVLTELRRLVQEGLDSGYSDRTPKQILTDTMARLSGKSR
jgi:antitoxin ParD1/3/4